MIVFVTSPGHRYTVAALEDRSFSPELPHVTALTYKELWSTGLPRATYVFTDIERLYPWERALAAAIFRMLQDAGMRCLNDPAVVLTRFRLLDRLHRAGINPFKAYRADEEPNPSAFPVFVRDEASHWGPIGELIHTRAELRERLRALQQAGLPLSNLLVVEFWAKPIKEGYFDNYAVWKVGSAYLMGNYSVTDTWVVKQTNPKLLTPELIEAHRRAASADVPAQVRHGFELGGIEFGRADYGSDAIHEINTNPMLHARPAPVPELEDTAREVRDRVARALEEIDCSGGPEVELDLTETLRSLHLPRGESGEIYRP